jgi:hypothetical protein
MGLRTLSEAIILQSAEDLLSSVHCREGVEFFGGEGFRVSAEMAGMTGDEKVRLLRMLARCIASGKHAKESSGGSHEGNKMRSGKLTHSHRSRRSAQLGAM